MGEQCPNWKGESCSPHEELCAADADTVHEGTPYVGESSYAIYGTMCLGGETPKIVSQRLEILKPMVNMMLVQEFAKRHDAPLIVSSRP
ncbi:MAG TPA: hypothetical protein VMQ52_04205 [Candidatus Saccharimonadales bacterium]|nr:hypothetical protein [Candidatus Saccharimonadales bacterium]